MNIRIEIVSMYEYIHRSKKDYSYLHSSYIINLISDKYTGVLITKYISDGHIESFRSFKAGASEAEQIHFNLKF